MSRARLWYCKNWIDFYTLFYVETHKIIEESRASLELKGSAGNATKFFVFVHVYANVCTFTLAEHVVLSAFRLNHSIVLYKY